MSDAATEWLSLHGFDPVYGALPLRRLIQTSIGDQLARGVLAGQIREGQKVLVDVNQSNDALVLSSQ